jgi:hypothetical protein
MSEKFAPPKVTIRRHLAGPMTPLGHATARRRNETQPPALESPVPI